MVLTGSPKNSDPGLSFPHSLDLLSGTTGKQKLGTESRSLYFHICCPLADPTACQPVVPPEGGIRPLQPALQSSQAVSEMGLLMVHIRVSREAACCRGHWREWPAAASGEEHNQQHTSREKLVGRGMGKTEQLVFLPWVPRGTSARPPPAPCH